MPIATPAACRLPLTCGAIPIRPPAPGSTATGTALPRQFGPRHGEETAALRDDWSMASGSLLAPPPAVELDLAITQADDASTRRRSLLLAALGHAHYGRIVVAGCGGGPLAVELAARCETLVLIETTDIARTHCAAAVVEAGLGARLAQTRVGAAFNEWPAEPCDLVVLNDYACWLDPAAFTRLIAQVLASLVPGGELACCDSRQPPADAPLTGDYVHARIRHELGLEGLLSHVEREFRLDCWMRLPEGA